MSSRDWASSSRDWALSSRDWDVAVIGSGFSGSILARILARSGWRTLLVERSSHPRFALGESTTPLANLALERLAEERGLPELASLATYGRWLEEYPAVRRGLKRGFSFYSHRPGEPWSPGSDRRLLVAASPTDRVADTHWLRSDVDSLLARQAVGDGVTLLEETVLHGVESVPSGVRLDLRRGGTRERTTAALVVDASGPAAVVARRLGSDPSSALRTRSALVFGHLRGLRELGETLEDPSALADAPYPEDRAAIHHLVEEGWIYLLPFDHGVTSCGLLLADPPEASIAAPEALWRRVVSRYPTIEALLDRTEVERAFQFLPAVQHRLSTAHGPHWVAMPHTYGFVDPLFSTGIAWGLRAVERLAASLVAVGPDAPEISSGRIFERYARRLPAELDQIDRLVATAYRARHRFDLFAAHSMLYFAMVSFAESYERLARPAEACWGGFLGAGDPTLEQMVRESDRRLSEALSGASAASYVDWVARTIEPFNVAGLAAPERGGLYPADLDELERRASRLAIEPARLVEGLERLKAQAAE